MNDYLQLEGKRALGTGGTSGIRTAIAAALHEAGATVLTPPRSRQRLNLVLPDQSVAADLATAEGSANHSAAVALAATCSLTIFWMVCRSGLPEPSSGNLSTMMISAGNISSAACLLRA